MMEHDPGTGAAGITAARSRASGPPRTAIIFRVTHLRLIGTALLAIAICSCAVAQAPLPEGAAAALAEAQAAAAAAQATYPTNYPDQPLWREAFAAAERARDLAPGRAEPLRFLAQAYGITGWTARAWSSWEAYVAAGGIMDASARAEAGAAASKLGYDAFRAGMLQQALPLLRAAREYLPDDLAVRSWLGQTYLALGDPAAAVPHLSAALSAQPQLEPLLERAKLGANFGLENADAYLAARDAYARGDFTAALRGFRQASETSPTFVEALRGVAASLGALGDVAGALEAWRRVASWVPGDPEASEAIERFSAMLAPPQEPEATTGQGPTPGQAPAPGQTPAQAPTPVPAPTPAPEAEPTPTPAPTPEPTPAPTPTPTPSQEPAPAPTPTPTPEPAPAPAPTPTPTPAPTPAPTPTPSPAAPSGQVTLFDGTVTASSVSGGGQGAFVFLDPAAGASTRLAAAQGVAGGALFVRADVSAKPSGAPMQLQLCLVPGDDTVVSPPCTDATRLVVTGTGAFSASFDMGGLASGAGVDWSQGLDRLLLVLRDDASRPLDERYTRGPDGTPIDLAPYYPVTMRLRLVLVPAGSVFAGW